MENFTAYNPTKVHFGKNVVSDLGKVVQPLGKKVLLIYGKGSVFKNGSYDDVKKQLESINAGIYEYNGIKPNPLASDVDEAAKAGIDNKVNLIVAMG
ncbi:MAG: iron-containing alcohol dehydrogenase [Bacteroidota bacterium]